MTDSLPSPQVQQRLPLPIENTFVNWMDEVVSFWSKADYMSLDRTCPGEIYLGLFLKEPGDEFPKARYRRCGSLLGKDRMYCDECQADMDMRRARNFAEDFPSTMREPS